MPYLYDHMQSNLRSKAEHPLNQISHGLQHDLPAAVLDCLQIQLVQDAGVPQNS